MTNPSLWNQLLVWPIINLLIALYKLFEFIGAPGALGFAVIAMTLLFRLALYPLMSTQLKSAKKMQQLKPKMDELSKKHGKDKQALQKAQLELYKEHGINPAAGCLPMLIQFPVLIALYRVFFQVLNNGNLDHLVSDINQILYIPGLQISNLDLHFFNTNLAIKPSAWQEHGVWLLLIPIITGTLQWVQTRMMMARNAKPKEVTVKKKSGKAIQKSKGSNEEKPEDMAGDIQKQMALITPVMFGFFAYQFPLGLSLYWNTFGIFGIIQQYFINRSKN